METKQSIANYARQMNAERTTLRLNAALARRGSNLRLAAQDYLRIPLVEGAEFLPVADALPKFEGSPMGTWTPADILADEILNGGIEVVA